MYQNKKPYKQIFLLFTCDEQCSTNSQRLIMATTSQQKLISKISELIKIEDLDYNNSEWDREKQIKEFKKDFVKATRTEINSKLKYGFFDYCYDGEEI